MKNLTKQELNAFVREHTGDPKTYFQMWKDDNTIVFGVWLTSDDAMDFAGEIKIDEHLKNI